MPWDTDADALKHKKGMSPHECLIWRRAANAILAKTGNEGRAIRGANTAVNNYRAAGKGKR